MIESSGEKKAGGTGLSKSMIDKQESIETSDRPRETLEKQYQSNIISNLTPANSDEEEYFDDFDVDEPISPMTRKSLYNKLNQTFMTIGNH